MPHLRTALVLLGLAALAAAVAYSDPTGTVPRMYLPAPEHLTRKRQTGTGLTVDYVNAPPAQAVQDAVQFAFNILENTFVFTQPVLVRFTFTALGWNSSTANVLGACSPNQFAPCPPTAATTKFYPSALYKQIAGVSNVPFNTACSSTQPGTGVNWDILARFNSDAPFSFSGNPTLTQYDFVYTFLHEMIHGLGFSGGVQQNTQTKQLVNGFAFWAAGSGPRIAAAYDWLIEDANGNSPADAFVTNGDSTAFNTAYNLGPLNLVTASSDALSSAVYRPTPYVPGSSWYHLSQAYLGTSNQMMTPSLSPGSIIHTPGVLTLRIMEEMGWTLQSGAIPTAQQASTLTGNVRTATTGSSFALTSAPVVASVALAALVALLAI